MRENPIHTFVIEAWRTAFLRPCALFTPRCLIVAAGACAALLTLCCAPVCRAQTFIRVPAPSVQQQDQSTVNAMPNPNGTGAINPDGTQGGPQEAVLSQTGRGVKMVDQSGHEIGNDGWTLFHGWRPTFYLNLNLGYDDNIFIEPHKSGDFVTKIQPGIVLGFGDYREQLPRLGSFPHEYEIPTDTLAATKFLYLDYHPTVQIFAVNSQENVVNESVLISGSYQFTKLILQGQLQYQTLSEVNTDVGGRLNSTLYSGTLTGLYQVDDKVSVDDTFTSFAVNYDGNFQDSVDTRDVAYFNYQVAPKTNVSAGVAGGYLSPENVGGESYEQLLGRVRWAFSDKLYLYASGGLEFRQETHNDELDGIFDIELTYAPFDGTRFLLSASRGTQATAVNTYGDTVVTTVQIGVQQRVIGRVYVSGLIAYENLDYEYRSNSYRTDNQIAFKLGAGMDLTSYAGIQLAYQFLNNDSTYSPRTFSQNLLSVQANFLY